MTKSNKLLKISSIIYLIASLFLFSFNSVIGGIVLTVGITLLSYSFLPYEELRSKKIMILIISIITFIFSKLIGILLFIAFDYLAADKSALVIENETEISSESKRIDLLLKIGTGMILVSGVLFATTSWNIISDLVKCLGLVLMGIIFLVLSYYTETKLKLIKSSRAYFYIGLIFILLAWIGIGYFGVFSEWFSYIGEGTNLVYFSTFVLLSAILFLIDKKYNKKEYQYLGYICCYICVYHLLTFFGLDLIVVTLIISVLTLLINIFIKDQTLSSVSKLLSYLFWVIIFIEGISNPGYINLIASIVNIINIFYLTFKYDDSIDNILGIIVNYILTLNIVINFRLENPDILILFLTTPVYLIVNYNQFNKNKKLLVTNQVIYHLITTITILTMINNETKFLVFSLMYGLLNLVTSYIVRSEVKINLYYQPVIIMIIIFSIFNFANLQSNYIYIISAIIYLVIHYMTKDKSLKNIYFIALSVAAVIATFTIGTNLLISFLIVAVAAYMYISTKHIWTYIFLLFSILMMRTPLITQLIPETLASVIILLVFGALTYVINDSKIRRINLIALVIPLYSLVDCFILNTEIHAILNNIFAFYILYLILRLFIKDIKYKDIIATIGTAILILNIIFSNSLLIGLYVGLLGIAIILITYNKKDYKAYFYCGVAITILNIIIQLGEFWSRIPFWLYLLLVGVGIISFVTYREIKKLNEPEKSEDIKEIKVANFCEKCGSKNNGGKYCMKCGNYLVIESNND